jgi:hypothetical protein
MSLQNKYLKYKKKYFNLKSQFGGSEAVNSNLEPINLIPHIHLEPAYIIDNLKSKYLFEKRLICMISTGRNQMIYSQKLFIIEYFQYLLKKSILYLTSKSTNPKLTCLTDDYNNINKLNLEILFENIKEDDIFNKAITNSFEKIIMDLDHCERLNLMTDNDSTLQDTLNKIQNTLVSIELSLPMYHFYTCVIGHSYSLGIKNETIVDINKLFTLHGLVDGVNSETTAKKAIIRASIYYNQIYKFIKENNETDLSKYIITDICNINSVTDIETIPFPNSDGTYSDKFYCVTEGNGRLIAMRIAIYKIIQMYPNFIPPKIKINYSKLIDVKTKVTNTNGVKNLYSLLLCIWLNTFYNITPPPGFKSQINIEKMFHVDNMMKIKLIEKMKNINYIFILGFIPDTYETPNIQWDKSNTL